MPAMQMKRVYIWTVRLEAGCTDGAGMEGLQTANSQNDEN